MGNGEDRDSAEVPEQSYELLDTLSHLLRRSHFHAEGLFSKTLGQFGVTSRQLALMVAVSQNPNASQRLVGELIALDENSVSDLLRRMDKNGLIERHSSREDGRSKLIRLSEKGHEILATIYAENRAYQDRLTDRLNDDETEQLRALLRKMLGV
ncbi:winged helix DNA-binding protein [Sulfitobacter sp. F26204]|uniref:MarR family winged helix-turn-helix transcriptional regulator n=1 Tax=Sulfitobacter sp. F26204 TaxID=2996014 RepID=UPI00225DF1EB|nr:MarR family transcriptional regulator [Sulfitobacter sp. F26204]MCX7561751.1 winged helix DNA-binding protein [Sulfitobacter sp. F26204]